MGDDKGCRNLELKRRKTERNIGLTLSRLIRKLPTVGSDFINSIFIRWYARPVPTVMQFNVTWKCNSRCVMCNIWDRKSSEKELNAFEFDTILSDSLFRKIETVLISGGEPTLRQDLFQIVNVLRRRMPRLKKLILYTNGFNVKMISEQLPQIIKFCNARNIHVTIRVSIDGIGGLHDEIRGVPHAFDRTMDSINFLEEIQSHFSFRFGIATTISGKNVYSLEDIVSFCRGRDIDGIFIMSWISQNYYGNASQKDELRIDSVARQFLTNFLKDRIRESRLLKSDAYYYDKVIWMLRGQKKRTMPCPFLHQGIVLDACGNIYFCSNSRKLGNAFHGQRPSDIFYSAKSTQYRQVLSKKVCPTCESSCLVGIALEKEVIPFIAFLIKRLYRY
jgi:MoaA/NifB/PqqE/SkfB family radical SAM enzyme